MSQHTKPCKECPWRRVAPRGWLGDMTVETFMEHAHSESVMDCHLGNGTHQCAGAAIYRANVSKRTRHPNMILTLAADPEKVFASPKEFIDHHTIGVAGSKSLSVVIEGPRPCNYAVWEWSRPSRAWIMRGRFATPQVAAELAAKDKIVVDVVGDTMVWWRGAWCQRKKPSAIPTLTIQKYDDSNQVSKV